MHNDDLIPNPPSAENTDSSTVPPNSATEVLATDAGQQGIFSSSDTRIETEHLPEVSEVAQQTPVSSISPVLRTESTVTGDLKLGGTSKKKKWPLFVALGTVVIIAVGVLVWINLAKPHRDLVSLQTKFNQFANYFLYETDNTSPVEGYYDYGDLYWLAQENADSGNRDKINQHFIKSEEKFQAFYEQYKKYTSQHPDKITDEAKNLVDAYLEQLEMLHYTTLYRDLTLDSMLSAYFEMPNELSEAIAEYYKPFESAKTEAVRDYGAEKENLAVGLLNAFIIYESLGCLNRETESVATECLANVEDEQLSIANRDYELFRAKIVEQSMSSQDISIKPYQSIWKISWGVGQ